MTATLRGGGFSLPVLLVMPDTGTTIIYGLEYVLVHNVGSSLKSADWVVWTPVGIAVGIACGAVLGVALGPAGVWLSLGLALGVTAGVMFAEYHFSRRVADSEGDDAVSPSAASVDAGEAPTRVLPEASPEPLPAAPEPLPEVPDAAEAVTVPVRKPRAAKAVSAKAPAKAPAPRKAPSRKVASADGGSDPIIL